MTTAVDKWPAAARLAAVAAAGHLWHWIFSETSRTEWNRCNAPYPAKLDRTAWVEPGGPFELPDKHEQRAVLIMLQAEISPNRVSGSPLRLCRIGSGSAE
jgi:hypothetical protein